MQVMIHYKNAARNPVQAEMQEDGGVKTLGDRGCTFAFLDVVNDRNKRSLISLSSIESIEQL